LFKLVGVGGGGDGGGGGVVFFRGCDEDVFLIDVGFVHLHVAYQREKNDVLAFVTDMIVDFVENRGGGGCRRNGWSDCNDVF